MSEIQKRRYHKRLKSKTRNGRLWAKPPLENLGLKHSHMICHTVFRPIGHNLNMLRVKNVHADSLSVSVSVCLSLSFSLSLSVFFPRSARPLSLTLSHFFHRSTSSPNLHFLRVFRQQKTTLGHFFFRLCRCRWNCRG